MQIRKTIDRLALWLSLATLLGTTLAGIYFGLVYEGTMPRLDRDFSAEFKRMSDAGDYAGLLYQLKLAADLNPAQRAQMLQNRITLAWMIGDVPAQKESMQRVAESGRVTDPAAYAAFASMLLEPRSALEGKSATVDAETIELATTYANRAIELKPDYALAHYDLGVALLLKKDQREAAGCFRKALEFDPKLAKARQRLQQLEITSGAR